MRYENDSQQQSDSDSDSYRNPNSDTTDFDFTQLEQSVLISKDDGLSKLIKGTDQYYYQYFLNILNQKGYQLDPIQQEHFKNYKEMKTKNYKKICLRRLFVEYDNLMNEPMQTEEITKRQREILQKINKRLFKINFGNLSEDTSTKQQNAFTTNVQSKELVSQFDNNKLAMDDYLKDAYTEKGIKKLFPSLLQQIDLLELIKAPNKVIEIFFNELNQRDQQVILNNHILQFFNLLAQKKDFIFTNLCFTILTIEQMEELVKLNKIFFENAIFVGNLYFKKFGQDNIQQENSQTLVEQNKEVLSNLNEAYIWTKQLSKKFNSLKQIVLRELLQYGIEIQHYDFDLLLDFLKDPTEMYQNITKSHRDVQSKIRNDFSTNWQEWHRFKTGRWINANQLIEKYLQKYFESNSDFSIFEQYLETHYLKKQKAISHLYKGEEVQDLKNYFTNNEIKQMNNTKVLYLCDNNKPYFIHGEPVNLYVELKNIQSLTIKIFQINMKNFYNTKTEQLTTDICLNGFIPTEEINFTYDCPPIKKVIKEFTFESIQKTERGTFIIEFIGNGLSCRAIIEKGRLCLRQTIVSAGNKYEIFDEKFEKLFDDRIGIWIEEIFYNLVKGEIVIPFPKEETKCSAIIQYGDFYQKENLQLSPERFILICSFILGHEQIQLGSDVSVIIIPKLTLNETNIGFEIFKDANVQISCQNEKGVPQTFNFKDINFVSQVPLELKFPINQKLLSIQIDVTGKIKQLHKKDDLVLEQTCYIDMKDKTQNQIFINQLLKFDDADGYSIFVLGKNGEPYKNVQVQVLFTHKLIDEQIKENLITDENGQIKLGFLSKIEKISSSVISTKYQIQKQEWKLLKQFSAYQHYFEQVVNLGEKVTLPFSTKLENVLLYQIKNRIQSEITPIKNVRNWIQFEENEITIEFNQKGQYLLRLLEEEYSFQFKVLDNTLKQCKEYLYTQNERIQRESLREINLKSSVTQLNDKNYLVQGDIVHSKITLYKKDILKFLSTQILIKLSSNFKHIIIKTKIVFYTQSILKQGCKKPKLDSHSNIVLLLNYYYTDI